MDDFSGSRGKGRNKEKVLELAARVEQILQDSFLVSGENLRAKASHVSKAFSPDTEKSIDRIATLQECFSRDQ